MSDLSIYFEFMDHPQINLKLWRNIMTDYLEQSYPDLDKTRKIITLSKYLQDTCNVKLITKTFDNGRTYGYKSAIIRFPNEESKIAFMLRYL